MTFQKRLTELIAPSFYPAYLAVKNHDYTHYIFEGGRGSTKSSFVSISTVLLIIRYPDCHALILRKVSETLRDSVYAQYIWAIYQLQLEDYFIFHVAPMEIIYKPTGQKIMFRGVDKKEKIKSIKVPFGYIGITHFEEKDQFAGREEIRDILQSTMRSGPLFWNFETNNPPISMSNWANKDSLIPRPDKLVHKSTFETVSRNWLGEQFFVEAEILKQQNFKAYEHEYLGIPTGNGGNVFENLVIRKVSDKEIKDIDTKLYGQDWGWLPDPNAFNGCAFHPGTRTLIIFEEQRANKCSNEDWLKKIAHHKDEYISADPASGGDRNVSWFKSKGFRMREAIKGPGSVDYSMKWLQSLRAIIIDPERCPFTAQEFAQYEYERTKDGEVISGYPDKDNHHIDCVRYATEKIWRRRGK